MVPRTPLLRPDRYFPEREPHPVRTAALFGLVLLATAGLVYGVGFLLVANVDGTVLVDNPERPPETFCGETAPESSVFEESDCDAPERVERNVDRVIRPVVGDLAGQLLVGMVLLVGGLALLLHAGAWLLGGEDGFSASLAVALWGLIPSLVVGAVGYAALWVVVDPVTVSPGTSPEAALEPLRTRLTSLEPLTTALSLVAAVWSGVLWRFGLEHHRGLSGGAAAGLAGLLAVLGVLAALG